MQVVEIRQRKSFDLKKHVGLIHSTNKLTLLERKISNALLYSAYDDLLKEDEHQIHIPTLCRLIGYNSKDYKTIKKSLMSLISTVLEWNLVDSEKTEGEGGIWMASAMLSDAKIEGPICTYSYSRRMRELCYHPEFYGQLNLDILTRFKSTYGIALYENCMRYQNISQTPWFKLPTYRKLLGVGDGKYEIFRDLNRRVIKPSVSEVNMNSPIMVTPEFKKQGTSVISIRFLISKKKERVVTKDCELSLIHRLIKEYGFSNKQAEAVLEQYEEEFIHEKMSLIESSSSYQQDKIEYLAKYLAKALADDYQPPKSSQVNIDKLRKTEEKNKLSHKHYEESLNKYRDYQNKTLIKMLLSFPAKEKSIIEKGFDKYIQSTVYDSVYSKDGFDNPLIRDRFGNYVRSKHPELVKLVPTFESFCEENKLVKNAV